MKNNFFFLNRKVMLPLIGGIIVFGMLFAFIKDHVSCINGFPTYKKSKNEPEPQKLEEVPMPVKVYKAAKVSFRDTLPALGTIRGFREFDLKFSTQGNIEYINFKEGEKITQGDIIASLDQKESLLKLEYAKMELEKQTKLFELGYSVETKLKQSQLEYQSAKAELDKTNLVAISDGYIGAIETDRGAYVSPQDKVGTFIDNKDVYAEFGIIEKDINKVKEGQNVEVTLDSFPDQVFKGQVDSISPIIEGRSRTLKIRSKLPNTDEKLKPGMFGRVNVLVYEKEDALVIPSSSFKKKEDKYLVFVVHAEENNNSQVPEDMMMPPTETSKENGKGKKEMMQEEPKPVIGTIEIRPIEIAYATPDAVEVKEGLEEGDTIVVDVEQELQDKAKVEITETQEGIF